MSKAVYTESNLIELPALELFDSLRYAYHVCHKLVIVKIDVSSLDININEAK